MREPRDMMVPCCHGSLLRPPLHGAWSTWSSIPGSSTHKGHSGSFWFLIFLLIAVVIVGIVIFLPWPCWSAC